ncbi:MAG: hypothetical protein R3C20_12105 [Planctomycetaceae bacterium]
MIIVDALVGILVAVALFYWAVSAMIDIGVFFIRCRGRSSTSAVPGVASMAGIVAFIGCRNYFQFIQSPLWMIGFILPDILYQTGELILFLRIRILKWPDKATQQSPEATSSSK